MIYIIPNYFENGIEFEVHLMKRFLKLLKENCRQVDEYTVELFGNHYNNISKV